MIIDAHVHVKGGDEYRREFTPEVILRTMDEAGVDRSVIFSICLPGRESNELTARCHAAAPDRFIPFAHVWAGDGQEALRELRRAVEELGCRGLKLHLGEAAEATVEQLMSVCADAIELNIPVLVDFANRFEAAEALVGALPDLKLIVAHLGAPRDERLVDRFIGLARQHPNVYLDSSYSSVPWKIADAIRELGAGRVIFGSDGPLIHPTIELAKIRVCNLDTEEFEQVTWRNIEGLLRT